MLLLYLTEVVSLTKQIINRTMPTLVDDDGTLAADAGDATTSEAISAPPSTFPESASNGKRRTKSATPTIDSAPTM